MRAPIEAAAMCVRRYAAVLLTALALSLNADASAQEGKPAEKLFAGEPTVAAVKEGCKISFKMARPTDVTVRILDKDGKVVRHLASGMVGLEKAVALFKPNSLEQEIVWDRKDDRGADAGAGPFSVELGVGLTAKFDKFLLDGHELFLNEITAFGGSNRTGHVFVGMPGTMIERGTFIKEFDRDGKYVRTIWPINPNIRKELLEAFYQSPTDSMWGSPGIKWGTRDYSGNWVMGELHDNARDGSAVGALTETAGGGVIGVLCGDASRRYEVWADDGRLIREDWLPWSGKADKGHINNSLNICADPEQKLVYVTDKGPPSPRDEKHGWIVACLDAATLEPVNKFKYSGLKKLDQPVYYLGALDEPGEDEAHFKGPTAAAVDNKGNIWVGDADCLKVYDAEGKFLKRIDKTTPGFENVEFAVIKVGANYRKGGIYFATGGMGRGSKGRKLYKIDSLETPGIVWEIPLGKFATGGWGKTNQIFVDSEANLVWVADGEGHLTLLRVEDKGATFEKQVIHGEQTGKLLKPQWMRIDSTGNIYTLDQGRKAIVKTDIDGKAFAEIKVAVNASDGYFALDKDANIYIAEWSWGKPFRLRKFSPDGKPMKIGEKDAISFDRSADEWMEGKSSGRVKGVCVAGNGDIYVTGTCPIPGDRKSSASWVNIYTKDGELKKAKFMQTASSNDIQMGRDGFYTVNAGVQASPGPRREADRKGIPYWTLLCSLQKYSLGGGTEGGEGHLWSHPGVGYVNSVACGYECAGAQVSVDADDMLWITEHMVYNVKAVDSAGNLVARIGTYGNGDCDGDPKGKNPKPAIPITWPQAVARHGDFVFIADRISARIVRCKLEYAERRQAPIN